MVTKVQKEMIDGLQEAVAAAVEEALGFDISEYYTKTEAEDLLQRSIEIANTDIARRRWVMELLSRKADKRSSYSKTESYSRTETNVAARRRAIAYGLFN